MDMAIYQVDAFATAVEAGLCGHATLGNAHVIATHLAPGADTMRFHTRSAGGIAPYLEGRIRV